MYLIIYDIADPARLRQVAKIIKRYGLRVQKSAFECDINGRQFRILAEKLENTISAEDKIFCYRSTTLIKKL